MRLMLIRPNMGRMETGAYDDEGRMEPLELGVLGGLTPPDVHIRLVDDRIETIPYEDPVDLVAITVETFKARRAYEISSEFRQRGVPVVLGGFHPTLLPEEALLHADAIVVNDAESVWQELIADARAGKLRPIYQGRPGMPQSNVLPRRDLFRKKDYLPISLVQFARGCRNACNYCAISAYSQQSVSVRPIGEVIREIKSQERNLVFFVDDNIVGDRDAAKQLFRALIPLRIRWVSQACIDMVHDTELMELMVASGCLGM